MASTTLAMSTWQYTVNGGGWQQGSGHDVSIGVDGSNNIYRGYVSFSLANFSASYLIQSGSLFFKRADSYGTKRWAIGLTDTKPPNNFSTSAFKHTVSSDYSSGSGSDNTISLTAAQLSAYVGKTVYVLFLAATSGNTYGEIETDAGTPDKRPTLTVNYNYAKSTINTASNGTIGSQQTITVTRQDSAYTHTLTATCAGRTETIATKSSATSFNWTPATATYAPLITTAMSASCTYTLTTYYGNTSVGTDSKTITLTLPTAAVAPSLSLSVVDNNGYASHFGGKFIVGKSAFKVTATPTFQYSATQSSLSISANGSTYSSSPATTGVVQSGKNSISATVKDSRSQTATTSTTVTLLAYASPNLSVNVQRCQQDGTADSTGAYCKVTSTYSITALDNINTRSLTVKYKKASAGSYTSVSRTISTYTGTDTYIFAADIDSSYDVQVVLADYFGSATVSKALSTAAVVFDLYQNGTGIAFGKVAESANLMDIAWPVAIRDRDVSIYDATPTRRLWLHKYASGIMSMHLTNSDGTPFFQMYTDGQPTSAPLPVSMGGTGMTANHKAISSAPTEVNTSYDFTSTAAFSVGDGVTVPNFAKGHYESFAADAVLWAVGADLNLYTAYRNNGTWHGQKNAGLFFVDTRSVNSSPNDYINNYPRSFAFEFKTSSTIGLPSGAATYAVLITLVPWTNNSGGWPTQLAISVGKMYIRAGTSATAWGSWSQL